MARPARQTFAKRQREKKRDEKRKEKEEKKKVRKIEKEQDPSLQGDDIVDASSISPFFEADDTAAEVEESAEESGESGEAAAAPERAEQPRATEG